MDEILSPTGVDQAAVDAAIAAALGTINQRGKLKYNAAVHGVPPGTTLDVSVTSGNYTAITGLNDSDPVNNGIILNPANGTFEIVQAGPYRLFAVLSPAAQIPNVREEATWFVSSTAHDDGGTARKIAASNDEGAQSAGTILMLDAGDIVDLRLTGDIDNTFKFKLITVTVEGIGS